MYQKSILPYTLFPTYLPQADSLLERSGLSGCLFHHPSSLSSYFFSTEHAGPYVPAGATILGWPNYGWPIEQGDLHLLHSSL